MLSLHVNYECLYDEIHKEGNTKKIKNPPKIILDEEI